jgi:hypothetical protein
MVHSIDTCENKMQTKPHKNILWKECLNTKLETYLCAVFYQTAGKCCEKRARLFVRLDPQMATLSTSVLNDPSFTTHVLLCLLWQSSPYSDILTQFTYPLTLPPLLTCWRGLLIDTHDTSPCLNRVVFGLPPLLTCWCGISNYLNEYSLLIIYVLEIALEPPQHHPHISVCQPFMLLCS